MCSAAASRLLVALVVVRVATVVAVRHQWELPLEELRALQASHAHFLCLSPSRIYEPEQNLLFAARALRQRVVTYSMPAVSIALQMVVSELPSAKAR